MCLIYIELMERGSLLTYLREDAKLLEPTLRYNHLKDILAQVASGMDYLGAMHYVHRDLRADNILLCADNTAKVADFGLAKLCNEDNVYPLEEDAKFPPKWTAPEVCRLRAHSSKSDVWRFVNYSYAYGSHDQTFCWPIFVDQENI